MSKFRKKPVVIEAVQFNPHVHPWPDERIIAESESLGAYFDNKEVGLEARQLGINIRDSYDAELAQLRATLAYERENVDKVLTVTRMQRDELAALRAELTEATSQSVQPGGRFLLYPEIEKMLSDAFEKGRKFERGESDE